MKRIHALICSLCCMLTLFACENDDAEREQDLALAKTQDALSIELDFENFRFVIDDEFIGPNDTTVRYKWYEKIGPEEAYVIFLNGRAEFVEKYDPMFTAASEMPWETTAEQTLADLPITFFAIDHEGQGLSGGLPSHIDDYDIYVENIRALISHIWKLENHIRPIYLMGHSTGSLIATRFAQKYPEYVDGMVFSSPLFGIKPPAGVTPEQLRMLVGGYALPAPYGFGLADRCSMAPEAPVPALAAIAQCLTDEGCRTCFADPTLPGCSELPLDWSALHSAWAFLNSPDSIGCQKIRTPEATCTFPGEHFGGTTSNYDYCFWTESHELSGPLATFGWLWQTYLAIDKMNVAENFDVIRNIPTMVLSSVTDPIVDASSHGAFCNQMSNCQLVEFHSDFENGPIYFHELLAETDRASVINNVRAFFESQLCL